jgi:2-polyprenyl-3-methyl-5-hydroxy-6-metoxy-1,4-benzoquinol methylase
MTLTKNIVNSNFIIRRTCPACASGKVGMIYQGPLDEPPISEYLKNFYTPTGRIELEYLRGAFYTLYECQDCTLIFQREIPGDEFMERLYEYWIDPQISFDLRQQKSGLDYYAYYAQEIMQIISFLKKPVSDLAFFDFGMGWGKWALMAKAFGVDVFGSELSRPRIEYVKSNGLKVIEWDAIPMYQFDFINTEQVFEHIGEPLKTLRHLKKALRPDGIIKISVPTANDIKRRLKIMDWKSPKGSKNSLNPVAPLEHINFYRRKSIVTMARAAGLKEVFLPMKDQFRYSCNWGGLKNISKNLLNPIYRNILRKQNYLFFRIS